jgi:hypothetical protein
MSQLISPIDLKGFYRRRQCSYLIDNTLEANQLTCSNETNLGRLCCFKNCPFLSREERDTQLKIRERLIFTAPVINNPKISFPDYYKIGRIEIHRGIRLIDWNGERWEVFKKEGVRWDIDDFTDDDFEVLNDALNNTT